MTQEAAEKGLLGIDFIPNGFARDHESKNINVY